MRDMIIDITGLIASSEFSFFSGSWFFMIWVSAGV
jgi:hypothetical protein